MDCFLVVLLERVERMRFQWDNFWLQNDYYMDTILFAWSHLHHLLAAANSVCVQSARVGGGRVRGNGEICLFMGSTG